MTRDVEREGISLAVEERGDPPGPTVVLVHGWPDTKALWKPIAERLADHHRHHVVAYDVRGAGDSTHPDDRDSYRVEELVGDLAAVIAATSPDRPIHLVGHDWGSVQGWEAVVDDRVAGRLASFTSISGPSLDHSGHGVRGLLRGGPAGIARLADQMARFSYILTFATPLPGIVRRLGPRGPAYDAAHGTHMYLANIPRRLRHPHPRRTDVPVQIIEATRDPVVRKAAIDASEPWVTNLWRRQLPGGHWLVRSHSSEIADWIAEFVAHIEGGPESDGLRAARRGNEPDRARDESRTAAQRQRPS